MGALAIIFVFVLALSKSLRAILAPTVVDSAGKSRLTAFSTGLGDEVHRPRWWLVRENVRLCLVGAVVQQRAGIAAFANNG